MPIHYMFIKPVNCFLENTLFYQKAKGFEEQAYKNVGCHITRQT